MVAEHVTDPRPQWARPLQLHATYDVHTDPEKIEASRIPSSRVVDVQVPWIMEEILEVIQLGAVKERIQRRIVEEIIDIPVPEVMEKTIEVGKHIRAGEDAELHSRANSWCAISTDSEGNSGCDTAHSARPHFWSRRLRKPPTFPARKFRRRKNVLFSWNRVDQRQRCPESRAVLRDGTHVAGAYGEKQS